MTYRVTGRVVDLADLFENKKKSTQQNDDERNCITLLLGFVKCKQQHRFRI